MTNATDIHIEWLESRIADYDELDRFNRTADGAWVEANMNHTRVRGSLVAAQAVLFAVKEGN